MLPFLLTSGVTTGALYALVALGLVVVYRSTGNLNFSHGELFMIGGFLAFSLIHYADLPYPVALLGAIALSFGLGVGADRLVYRRLLRAPGLTMVLATVGFSYVLRGIARYVWGGRGEYMTIPPLFDPAPIFIHGIPVLPQQLVVLAGAVLLMLAFALVFRLTTAGRMMQAVSENPTAAYLVGIRVERVYTLTWGVGAALAAAAAALMAPLTILTPDVGFDLLLKSFAATIVGGLGSMPGAVIGGFIVGIGESLAGGYIDTSFQDVSAFVLIMVVLVIRPTGLFGAGRARQA